MSLSRRTFLTTASSGILASALPLAGQAQGVSFSSATKGIESVETTEQRIALTFDDGPHRRLTPRLLDMLAQAGLKATFFVVGERAARAPELLKRISDEGHEIGNHSWSHPFLDRLSDAAMIREVDRTSEAIFDATGRAPVVFRPPYGAFSKRQTELLRAERGLTSILWSVDPHDWRRPGSSVVASRILSGLKPGAIVLAHDIHGGTIEAMPAVFSGVRERGYRTQTMSDLLGWPNWHSLRFERR